MAKHRLVNKGLTGCGINTAAAVGTVFNVTYWVFDGGQPTANATVTRSVVISQRCKDDENFCADFSGGFFCSPMLCRLARAQLDLPDRPSNVTLTPVNTSTVFVE